MREAVFVPEVEGDYKGPGHRLTATQAAAAERCMQIVEATLQAEREMFKQEEKDGD